MDDARYDQFRSYFPERKTGITLDQYRKRLLDGDGEQLNFVRDHPEHYETELQRELSLINPKVGLYELNNSSLISDDMLRQHMVLFMGSDDEKHDGAYFGGNNPTIFLAVGDAINVRFVVCYFTSEGEVKIVSHPWETSMLQLNKGVSASGSHPNPQDFLIDPHSSPDMPSSYAYGKSKTPGIEFRHELVHDVFITQRQNKGEKPDYSEYNTDIEAMRTIQEAWDKWIMFGYKDNSGYYFVFRLPPEAGGGYILTRRKKT